MNALGLRTIPLIGGTLFGICLTGCHTPQKQGSDYRRPPVDVIYEVSQQSTNSELRAYDEELISAVERRWYDLLDTGPFSWKKPGKIVVCFTLYSDGRVGEVQVVENTAGRPLELSCLKAIEDPAPYKRWPEAMREMVGKDHREIKFTFHFDTPNRPN